MGECAVDEADARPLGVVDIHEEISRLFALRKYPWLTGDLQIDRMVHWGTLHAQRLNVDEEAFLPRVTTVFWAVAHVQMSLGHALLARQSLAFPRGTTGTSYTPDDVPSLLAIPDQYFWYYAYMTAECLYRCWERLTRVLRVACFPSNADKLYFDGLVNAIYQDPGLSRNPAMNSLLRQRHGWNRVCADRNRLSHGESSPSAQLDIVGREPRVYGPDGRPAVRLEYTYSSADQELDKLVSRYKALVPAIQAVQGFIEGME